MSEYVRPTKKQRELLGYIENFIKEQGYSPSYREIMVGLQYNSVATVALHINNLIKRGHLIKREHSARSLEVVYKEEAGPVAPKTEAADEVHEQWLLQLVSQRLSVSEGINRDEAQTLVNALRLLGFEEPAEKLVVQLNRVE